VALVAISLIAPAPAVGATDLSSEEVRSLAARAADDADALRRLRAVDEVDGVPVDLPTALDGARGDQLAARLRTLAADPAPGSTAPNAATARARAGSILADRRFRPAPAPRPFRGVLESVSRRLHPVQDALVGAWRWLAARLPGGERSLWGILGAAAVLIAAVVSARIARRRARAQASPPRDRSGARAADPGALERAAEEAERAGDLRAAVRLRFQAGLLRLDRARVIEWHPSLTSADIRRRLGSPTFARLARSFDEIVYGGRDPRAEDVAGARRGWAELIEAFRPARGGGRA
jgi:hypothetical protein